MIAFAQDRDQWMTMSAFLQEHANVHPSLDLRCIGWVSDGKLVIVVGFNGFVGKVAQIHLAFAPGWSYSPRQMLREVFHYAFVVANLEMLLGIVNSKNVRAMRFDLHLGFTERYRLKGMHDDGGDLVVLGMMKDECHYLAAPKVEAELEHA